MHFSITCLAIGLIALSPRVAAENEDYQDMSDPLAVYTQGGFGITDKGLNIKFGQAYDTGSDTSAAMNILEIKGLMGDTLGWRDADEPLYGGVDNAIDAVRLRNFNVDLTNGRGAQIDVNYNVDRETADASYSFIQALPKWGALQLYPLGGVGVTVQNDAQDGYKVPGTFAAVGFYGKFDLTEKVWLNYNPLWLTTLSGSDAYKDTYYAGDGDIFTHELALSY